MATQPLMLTEMDLRPLVENPDQMDSAIDAMEQATLRHHQGKVRDHGFVDLTERVSYPTVVQLRFAADDEQICGLQMFAEGSSGNDPTLPNARLVILLDPETRQLRALVDYRSISPLRVGATAGVGLRYLAPARARTAGVLGSAQQARTQLQAIRRTVPTLERARVFSPTREHREAFAKEMTDWLGLPVEAVASAQEAAAGADVVALANNSGAPILDLAWLKPGSLVISIGGSRMPPEVLKGPRVVATTWERLAAREPYASAVKAGAYSRQEMACELADLILGQATPRRTPQETVVFELDVLSIWGVAAADWAYRWALKQGAGTPFSLSIE